MTSFNDLERFSRGDDDYEQARYHEGPTLSIVFVVPVLPIPFTALEGRLALDGRIAFQGSDSRQKGPVWGISTPLRKVPLRLGERWGKD